MPVCFKAGEDKKSVKLQNLHLEQQVSNSVFQEVLSLLITAVKISYFKSRHPITKYFSRLQKRFSFFEVRSQLCSTADSF